MFNGDHMAVNFYSCRSSNSYWKRKGQRMVWLQVQTLPQQSLTYLRQHTRLHVGCSFLFEPVEKWTRHVKFSILSCVPSPLTPAFTGHQPGSYFIKKNFFKATHSVRLNQRLSTMPAFIFCCFVFFSMTFIFRTYQVCYLRHLYCIILKLEQLSLPSALG